jgi:hypothetical protein
VVAERSPEPGRLHEQLQADVAHEGVVVGGSLIPRHGVGDGGIQVEGRGAGRPVPRGLLPADRPPRKDCTLEVELAGPFAREVEGGVSPAERVGGRARCGVGEDGQDEALRVPERVTVVAGARQSLGGDGALLGAGTGLERVEEREANRLLQLDVAL